MTSCENQQLRTGDGNVDISEQLLYQVKDLVLCRISTTLALCPAKILTAYTIMLVIRFLPLTVFRRELCFPMEYSARFEIQQFLVKIIGCERILQTRSDIS